MMKQQFEQYSDKEELQKDYECGLLKDLQFCVKSCEQHMASEKTRIKEEFRRKKPPLSEAIDEALFAMKKEAAACIAKAEQLDDDAFREKEALMKKSEELTKERELRLEEETKKARDAMVPEEVCEICGQAYQGDEAKTLHLKFKVHEGYRLVREKIDELKPKVEEFERLRKEAKEQERKRRRKEEWDSALERDTDRGRDRDRGRGRDEERTGGRSRSQGRRRGRDGGRDGGLDGGRDGQRDSYRNSNRDGRDTYRNGGSNGGYRDGRDRRGDSRNRTHRRR